MKSLLADIENVAEFPLDPSRYLLVGNARWKRSVFLYRAEGRQPAILAKMPGNDVARRQCETEYRALSYLAEQSIPNALAPRPLGTFSHGGQPCYLQEVLVSKQMLSSLPLFSRRPRVRDFRRVTRHLIDIYRSTSHAEAHEAKSYALCFQHGDFWIGNLGLLGKSLALYDFEYATRNGMPLFDLLQFGLYYRVALGNVGTVGHEVVRGTYTREAEKRVFAPSVADVETVLIQRGPFAKLMRICIAEYVAACGISRQDAAVLIRAYIEDDRGISGLRKGWEQGVVG